MTFKPGLQHYSEQCCWCHVKLFPRLLWPSQQHHYQLSTRLWTGCWRAVHQSWFGIELSHKQQPTTMASGHPLVIAHTTELLGWRCSANTHVWSKKALMNGYLTVISDMNATWKFIMCIRFIYCCTILSAGQYKYTVQCLNIPPSPSVGTSPGPPDSGNYLTPP